MCHAELANPPSPSGLGPAFAVWHGAWGLPSPSDSCRHQQLPLTTIFFPARNRPRNKSATETVQLRRHAMRRSFVVVSRRWLSLVVIICYHSLLVAFSWRQLLLVAAIQECVTKWNPWSECTEECGSGRRTATVKIIQQAECGGKCSTEPKRESCGETAQKCEWDWEKSWSTCKYPDAEQCKPGTKERKIKINAQPNELASF